MKEQKKKRLVAILLFVSCLLSGYMLYSSSEGSSGLLKSLGQADSLIHRDLASFNISKQQIRVSTISVDSNLNRKTYRVDIPFGFSKTQLHAELNRTFHNFSVKTPAKVTFPEKNLDIHLQYNGTVIRTISLQTDPDLMLNRNRASILIAFKSLPGDELIQDLASLGEPFPLVLKVRNPLQANELRKQLSGRYDRILFWLQNDNNEDLIKADWSAALTKLKQMENVLPEAMMLTFNNEGQLPTNGSQSPISQSKLTFVDAGNALMLHEELGKASFFQELNKLKTNRIHPVVIINGNETTLSWLGEKLAELKKAGVDFVPPPKSNF